MERFNVRFKKIVIKNWKNVKNGEIVFNDEKNRLNFHPSIVGLYGQNGSGKTTLIQVIDVLKTLLKGESLPDEILDLVSVGEDKCSISVEFSLTDYLTKEYRVFYDVILKKENILVDNSFSNAATTKEKIMFDKEILSYAYYENNLLVHKKNDLMKIDFLDSIVFLPESKLKIFTGDNKEIQNKLFVNKIMSHEASKSFIYNASTLQIFREACQEEIYLDILNNLVDFANYSLFIIDTKDIGLINSNIALPYNFKIKDNQKGMALGHIALNMKGISSIPNDVYDIVEKSIENMNIVLEQIIPDLNIKIKKIGTQINENGLEIAQVQLYSIRNNKTISLENESEGIKKLVSILQILIVMFNNPSTTVAIDELDSGIFEYLLGEILNIISESAKGQLIFSSHNLRPLETIDKKYVYFTTTNENNRYIKMANVKKNNNLRDFYFRELLLDGQKEELYEQTNNGAISLAFKEAGVFDE